MTTITKTFRDFFTKSFKEEKVYERIQPNHFKMLYEMAMWNDIIKKPVNIDKEDLDFLQQFPHRFWAKAMNMRYQMLFTAIEKRHKEQAETIEKIGGAIKQAMLTQDWDQLQGAIPDDKIRKLQQYYTQPKVAEIRGSYNQKKGGTDPLDETKEKEAWETLKGINDHIDDPEGPVPFSLKTPDYDPRAGKQVGSNKSAPGNPGFPTINAKPLLNRLYHKLERTKDYPHIDGSGLEGEKGKELGHEKGQYGYFMHDPVRAPHLFNVLMNDGQEFEIHAFDEKDVPRAVEEKHGDPKEIKEIKKDSTLPHSTAGMKFPVEENIEKRIAEYMNLLSHRMFGDLPEDVEWLKTGSKDVWTMNSVKEELQKKYEQELENPSSPLYQGKLDAKKKRKTAAILTNQELIKLAETGKLNGPPIPGIAPKGFPVTVVDGPNGKKLVSPDLWLPHQKKTIQVKQKDGSFKPVERDVPIVNPANFYRKLGSDEGDFATDHEGKKVFDPDTKKPIFRVPQEKLRGHNKEYVHVDDNEYRHGHGAKGAFQFNHDSHGAFHLDPSDEKYGEVWDKVFGDEGMVKGNLEGTKFVPNENGSYYKDIIDGILNCAKGTQCGGATTRERTNILANVDALHSVITYMLSQNLRNERYHGDEKKNRAARRAYANNITSDYAQKDLGIGGGSRRLRTLGTGNQSLDATTTGSEGGTQAITHDLNVVDKRKIGLTSDDETGDTGPINTARGKGERRFDTSHQSTPGEHSPYNLANIGRIVKELTASATKNDTETKSAIALSKVQSGNAVLELLQRGIKDHGEIMDTIVGLLTNMYRQQGLKRINTEKGWVDEALEEAKSTVEQWVKGGARGETLVQQFIQHPMVQDAMKAVPQDQPKRAKRETPFGDTDDLERQKNASAWLHRKLEKIQGNKPLLQAELVKDESGLSKVINQMVATYFGGVVDDKILDSLQAELDKTYKTADEPPVTAAAAKEIAPKEIQPVAPTMAAPKAGQAVPVPKDDWATLNSLTDQKDWLALVHHPKWLQMKTNVAQKRKLLPWFHANKDKFQPFEYASAVANLTKSLEGQP